MERILYLFGLYLLIGKVFPYFAYSNYFMKSKVENYTELKKLALKLKGKSKFATLKNVYDYMIETYSGYDERFKLKNVLTLYRMGDFSTRASLNKKEFMWCHNQNRLARSILVNTGMFSEKDIVVERTLVKSSSLHQCLIVRVGKKKFRFDTHCRVFEKVD